MRAAGCFCIYVFSVLAYLGFAPVAHGQSLTGSSMIVRMEGCPSDLRLVLPAKFSRANSPEQKARRNAILERLHSNPGRRARYADVFLTDWNSELAFPQISVASLGSFISRQGKISEIEWQQIKTDFVRATQAQHYQWMAQGIAKLKPGRSADIKTLESKIASVTADRPNAILALGTTKAVIGNEVVESHTAAKLIYAKRCVAYVIAAVKGSELEPMNELLQVVAAIEVE